MKTVFLNRRKFLEIGACCLISIFLILHLLDDHHKSTRKLEESESLNSKSVLDTLEETEEQKLLGDDATEGSDLDLIDSDQHVEARESEQSLEMISQWKKLICKEDKKQLKKTRRIFMRKKVRLEHFNFIVMAPLQTGCNNMMKIGGMWTKYLVYDGGKYVCMDDFVNPNENCLIYSFGIRDDITFETAMVKQGCEIHGYDHTIPFLNQLSFLMRDPKFKIHRKGIGIEKARRFTTLEDELKSNKHENKSISYLKMDIEGDERKLLLRWGESGLLDRVNQIGVEFHDVTENFGQYYKILRLLDSLGFKIIAFEPNMTFDPTARTKAKSNMFGDVFEIVFRKVSDSVFSCK